MLLSCFKLIHYTCRFFALHYNLDVNLCYFCKFLFQILNNISGKQFEFKHKFILKMNHLYIGNGNTISRKGYFDEKTGAKGRLTFGLKSL